MYVPLFTNLSKKTFDNFFLNIQILKATIKNYGFSQQQNNFQVFMILTNVVNIFKFKR